MYIKTDPKANIRQTNKPIKQNKTKHCYLFCYKKTQSNKLQTNTHSPRWKGHKFKLSPVKTVNDGSLIESQERSNDVEFEMRRLDTEMMEKINIDEEEKSPLVQETVGDSFQWDIAALVQVFPKHNETLSHRTPWTLRVANSDPSLMVSLNCWGPYRSEYRILNQTLENGGVLPPLVLIGTGAGCAFVIDFIQFLKANVNKYSLAYPCYVYFSSKSLKLFQFFTDETAKIPINNVFINAHLTRYEKKVGYDKNDPSNYKKERDASIGRMSFEEVLDEAAGEHGKALNVYFCGAPSVQEKVGKLCKKWGVEFLHGHSFH